MNSKTLQFMDKQIMDLSNSTKPIDSIDLMNPQRDDLPSDRKEEILPSYDFQPMRPSGISSLSFQPIDIDSFNVGGTRAWNSADSNTITSAMPIKSYSFLDSVEPSKVIFEKGREVGDVVLLSEIDRLMKKHSDNLLCALDRFNTRVSQLESRTHHLESSIDHLKVFLGNSHGSMDGKMQQLENILREIQDDVKVIKNKQDVVEGQLELAKLQIVKEELQAENQNAVIVDSVQQAAPSSQQIHPPLASVALVQPSPTLALANVPPLLPSQQSVPPSVQNLNQLPQSQSLSVPHHFSPPGEPEVSNNQQFQVSQLQQFHHSLSAPPQQLQPSLPAPPQQFQPSSPAPPQQFRPSPPAPPQQFQPSSPAPPSQPYQPSPPSHSQPQQPLQHISLSSLSSFQPESALGHYPEEGSHIPPQNYPQGFHLPPSQPSSGAPPSQQFYGNPSHVYEPPSSRPCAGFPSSYHPPSGPGENFTYNGPSSLYGGSGSPSRHQRLPSPAMGPQSSGSGYPQLPTARILPHALPTSGVGSGAGSGGTGNRVPIDDVVDKVTSMGFSREQVRATVRNLTESGHSVDLNVVLDKLMNDGEGQRHKGWHGR